ncbi:MAG: hypothetical protein OXH00_07985 [Candidatus Poribacteria bacterium]|nr:hypothetical protein [Candidatus Poribacteria bacterium]
MKTFRQSFGILIAGALLFFLIKPFIQAHKQLEDITLQIQWRWLVTSFGFILLYRSFYVWPFTMLLRCITPGGHVWFRNAFALFHLANITRYLPGRIWGVVRLLSLSHRFGLSKTAVGGSLTLHVGIETALGGFIAMSLLSSKQMRDTALSVLEKISGHTLLFTLAVVGAIAGMLFLIPKVSVHARQALKTLREIGQPFCQKSFWCSAACLRGDGGVGILASHILLWSCQGFAFYLFVRSLAPVAWADAGILTACYAFAWIVGFLSFLTPGGLGIREGLLGLLLSSYMPVPQATLVALLCRIWMLSAELILASIAFFLNMTETSAAIQQTEQEI